MRYLEGCRRQGAVREEGGRARYREQGGADFRPGEGLRRRLQEWNAGRAATEDDRGAPGHRARRRRYKSGAHPRPRPRPNRCAATESALLHLHRRPAGRHQSLRALGADVPARPPRQCRRQGETPADRLDLRRLLRPRLFSSSWRPGSISSCSSASRNT